MAAGAAGRVVLLTGSTGGGMGQAVCKALLSPGRGDRVCAGVRSLQKGAALFPDTSYQSRLKFFPLDLTDAESPRALVRAIEERYGAVDVVVNCAGMGRNWPLECETESTIQECMSVNCLGPIRLCQAALPGMKRRGKGHIVNVTSIGGLVADQMTEVYNAAKFGLTGFSESLALTAAEFGVHVSVVCPGPTNSVSLWESVVEDYERSVCDTRTQNIIDAKVPMMKALKESAGEIEQPDGFAERLLCEVLDSADPEPYYVWNSGYCQDALDSKYRNLNAYARGRLSGGPAVE